MTRMIRVASGTAQQLKEQSIIHDVSGRPIEPYDSIIRRALTALESQQHPATMDVSQL